MATSDDDIDRLYQGDLETFVAQRNALAKSTGQPALKTLEKPSVPAWAVNHLFWRERPLFDRVVAASEARRDAHRRLLAGQATDVRAVESTHAEVVREAQAAARALIAAAGHPVSAATLESVARTLEALPHPDANGRLVRPLSPAGLEALSGLSVAPQRPATAPAAEKPRGPSPAAEAAPTSPSTARIVALRAREREQADRDVREREARERDERRVAAQDAVDTAAAAFQRAKDAVADAEAVLSAKRAERDAAAAAYERARRVFRDLV